MGFLLDTHGEQTCMLAWRYHWFACQCLDLYHGPFLSMLSKLIELPQCFCKFLCMFLEKFQLFLNMNSNILLCMITLQVLQKGQMNVLVILLFHASSSNIYLKPVIRTWMWAMRIEVYLLVGSRAQGILVRGNQNNCMLTTCGNRMAQWGQVNLQITYLIYHNTTLLLQQLPR